MGSLSWIPRFSKGNGRKIQIIRPNNVFLKTKLSTLKERNTVYESLAWELSQGEIPQESDTRGIRRGKSWQMGPQSRDAVAGEGMWWSEN